jgi:radical SAM protein with 4Fe4S-binding SPASM domain
MYVFLYNFVRRSPFFSFLFHRIFQGKWLNEFPPYLLIYRKLITRRARRWMVRPPFLEFTLTDMCNARCVMCPPEVHMGKTVMGRELFERAAREGAELGIKKAIVTGGEPLLDPDVAEKIRFLKRIGYDYVHLFTNGQLLTAERSEQLIRAGLDSLTVSIDSVVREEYRKIRIGLDFDTVMANIRGFPKVRKALGSAKPLFRINRVNMLQNSGSAKQYLAELDGAADIVELMDAHNFAEKKGRVYEKGQLYTQKRRFPCNLLFQKLALSPHGDYLKCSIDLSSSTAVLGNIRDKTMRQVLDDEYRRIKETLLRYDWNVDGCRNCTFKQSWWADWDLK